MQPQSAEYQVTRTYVEWLADLPWSRTTPDRVDVREVRRCLDEDHYGLEQVKKRIVEYSAIRQLRRDKKGPILLFVGPAGVGKTSLGKLHRGQAPWVAATAVSRSVACGTKPRSAVTAALM